MHDEAYEYFTYDGAQHFSPASIAGSEPYAISLFSLSKSYGFASWRIGYMTVPEHLYMAVKKMQDTNLICPPVISQHSALGALEAGSGYCLERLAVIARMRRVVLDALAQIGDIATVAPTKGAFYCFVRVHADLDSMQLVERLVRQYKVAVMPGVAFGMGDACCVRVAFGALDETTATEGIGRLTRGLREIVSGQ